MQLSIQKHFNTAQICSKTITQIHREQTILKNNTLKFLLNKMPALKSVSKHRLPSFLKSNYQRSHWSVGNISKIWLLVIWLQVRRISHDHPSIEINLQRCTGYCFSWARVSVGQVFCNRVVDFSREHWKNLTTGHFCVEGTFNRPFSVSWSVPPLTGCSGQLPPTGHWRPQHPSVLGRKWIS